MISKWFEVSVDLFSIIFNTYWKKEKSWTCNNVIEIQNPISILEERREDRLYIGYKIDINKYSDVYTNYLKIKTLEYFKEVGYEIPDTYMSLCMLTDIGPDIIPIQKEDKHYQIVLSTCYKTESYKQLEVLLRRPLTSWYVKEGGKYIIGNSSNQEIYPIKDRFIRFRLIDYNSWERIISDYIKYNQISYLQIYNDIPKEILV